MLNLKSKTLAYAALLCVFVLFAAAYAEARGRGGGRGGGGFYAGVVVGSAVTTTHITTLPCTTKAVIVNGVTYYNCSSEWYQRGYAGSQVTYVVVKAPAGH